MEGYILFCESPIEVNKVDEDFEEELLASMQQGFNHLLFNFEDLTNPENSHLSTKRIRPSDQLVNLIYRGWMLTPKEYSILYNLLFAKNYKLINTPEEYRNCHYLPDSLKYIRDKTPLTVFQDFSAKNSLDLLIEKAKVFGEHAVVIKDYVKSEKHDWETACYVNKASNTELLKQSITNLLSLRGKYLNTGVVIRQFIDLNALTIHSKSGMPLTEEYRMFFCNKKLMGIYNYWEEGEYTLTKTNTEEFELIAQRVESNFFSMDIARQKNGKFIIIELGDAQVSGLPDKMDKTEFYNTLKLLS